MARKFREVTKDELRAWVKAYPRKLITDVNATGEPPQFTFNDFTLGNWPDSVVARFFLEGYSPEGSYAVLEEIPETKSPAEAGL